MKKIRNIIQNIREKRRIRKDLKRLEDHKQRFEMITRIAKEISNRAAL